MEQVRYRTSVEYTADTVKKMEKIRHRTFEFMTTAVRVLCSGIMVVFGVLMGGNAGVIFVAFGCILLMSNDVIGRWRTDQTIKMMNGKTIKVRYELFDTYFLTSAERDRTKTKCTYEELICILEDNDNYYLFPNEHQIFMMSKASLAPKDPEGFKKLIAKKSGREWMKPLSLLTANLKQIINFQKAVKRR